MLHLLFTDSRHLGFVGAWSVVDAGMNDTAVAAALMARHLGFRLEHNHPSMAGGEKGSRRRQADDTAADHGHWVARGRRHRFCGGKRRARYRARDGRV